ncbi:hypothetical protein EVAR_3650_1 [Eumeta japonica]|uniref:Uncharacterized protein n=1 Tax=Eumeta variegata TaxID=151549 RepID=A0A4C1SRV8_EUMVA|nr:hypothetical protein EVAR_3650_1 [Eumeta japonica]
MVSACVEDCPRDAQVERSRNKTWVMLFTFLTDERLMWMARKIRKEILGYDRRSSVAEARRAAAHTCDSLITHYRIHGRSGMDANNLKKQPDEASRYKTLVFATNLYFLFITLEYQ